MNEQDIQTPADKAGQVDESRRAALRAIRKYAFVTAGATVVALSAQQAVAQAGNSNGCTPSGGNPSKC